MVLPSAMKWTYFFLESRDDLVTTILILIMGIIWLPCVAWHNPDHSESEPTRYTTLPRHGRKCVYCSRVQYLLLQCGHWWAYKGERVSLIDIVYHPASTSFTFRGRHRVKRRVQANSPLVFSDGWFDRRCYGCWHAESLAVGQHLEYPTG